MIGQTTRRLLFVRALVLVGATVAAGVLAASALATGPNRTWVAKATSICEQAGGTLTTPGGTVINLIFDCTFPPSINVHDILGTRLLDHDLLHVCFGPAHGLAFGPPQGENAVACFGPVG
jgi:hypothetical protein